MSVKHSAPSCYIKVYTSVLGIVLFLTSVMTSLSPGKWICPWHHCDLCGKRSIKLCSECPNSFCPSHIEGNIFQIPDDKLVCSDHDELLSAVETSKLEALANMPAESILTTSASETNSDMSGNHSDSESSGDNSPTLGESLSVAEEMAVKGQTLPSSKRNGSTSGYSESSSVSSSQSKVDQADKLPKVKRKGSKKKTVASGDDKLPGKCGKKEAKRHRLEQLQKAKSADKANSIGKGVETKKLGSPEAGTSCKGRKKKDAKQPVLETPMFDDNEEDEFGKLVIDIPLV